jgi:ADP-ribose pyrophosphatase YjhB (NUDIX family)
VSQKIVERTAARILLLDPEDRILLQHVRPNENQRRTIWITPGGELASGETHRQAALRELREEVGQATVALGPCVWVREHEFEFRGTRYRQRERFFLAWTKSVAIDSSGLEPIEVEMVLGHRWWKLSEIEDARQTVFAPRLMAQLLAPLIDRRIPERPIDVGI